uniref:SLC12A transporter C-terminal domain-containing protein n=1 Tax=Plectus sambesii TaxID=2011161 RepID=A0A914XSC4_9BILA
MKPNTIVIGFHDAARPSNTLHESRLLKDLKFAKIDRAEVVEYFTAKDYMPQEMNEAGEHLSTVEYVHIVRDVLKLHKNICIARHFHRLDKEALFRNSASGHRKYVDVWPVDMLKPGETGWGWDNSCLFLLQLACILSMSSRWKTRTTLRVFLCVTSLQDMHRRERQLKQMLDQLRIFAKSLVVPWDHVICHLGTPEEAASADRDAADLPEAYLKAMNEMIKKNSLETAIVFINMPIPPAEPEKYERYIANLEKLTDDLPPTLLVHGLASVISTAL